MSRNSPKTPSISDYSLDLSLDLSDDSNTCISNYDYEFNDFLLYIINDFLDDLTPSQIEICREEYRKNEVLEDNRTYNEMIYHIDNYIRILKTVFRNNQNDILIHLDCKYGASNDFCSKVKERIYLFTEIL